MMWEIEKSLSKISFTYRLLFTFSFHLQQISIFHFLLHSTQILEIVPILSMLIYTVNELKIAKQIR